MIRIRHTEDRGETRLPWLDSRHTFSFGDYHDNEQMGFRSLRVINEDHVDGQHGFGMHPHRDMEILSFVYGGALEHVDDIGNRVRIDAGEVQRITAGSGIRHAEHNPTERDTHFLQVWIEPDERGLAPAYEKGTFATGDCHNCLQLAASKDGHDGSISLHQDVEIYSGTLDAGQAMELAPKPDRHLWIQVVSGRLKLGDDELIAGDGAAISDEDSLWLLAHKETRFLLFDLP